MRAIGPAHRITKLSFFAAAYLLYKPTSCGLFNDTASEVVNVEMEITCVCAIDGSPRDRFEAIVAAEAAPGAGF